MNGEKNRGYDGRGSSGSDAEGRGGNPKRDGLVRRTAVESKKADTSGGTLAGTISRGKSGYESFKRAASKGPVGENGEPLILYHGTGEDFEMIERRDGRNYDTSHGIYLTTSPSVANEYAFRSSNTGEQYIHPVAINSQKIAYFDGDSFFQNPDYQNYVAKLIERYNSMLPGGAPEFLEGPKNALYPFGFGLSYTRFEYSDLHIEKIGQYDVTVSCAVQNAGEVDGDEVVQLYIDDVESSVVTPPLLLKGFERIRLKRGESRQVTFHLNEDSFQLMDIRYRWTVEPGRFRILIGAASNDLRLEGDVML